MKEDEKAYLKFVDEAFPKKWEQEIQGRWHDGDIFCSGCKHLSLTEEEQTDSKYQHHMCKILKKQLFHRDKHPRIVRGEECIKKDLKCV